MVYVAAHVPENVSQHPQQWRVVRQVALIGDLAQLGGQAAGRLSRPLEVSAYRALIGRCHLDTERGPEVVSREESPHGTYPRPAHLRRRFSDSPSASQVVEEVRPPEGGRFIS